MHLPDKALRILEGYELSCEMARPRGTVSIMARRTPDIGPDRPAEIVVKIPPKGRLSSAALAHRERAIQLACAAYDKLDQSADVRMVRCIFYDPDTGVEILERAPGRQILRGLWQGLWVINPLVPRRYTLRGMYKIGQWLRSLHNAAGCGDEEDFLDHLTRDIRIRVQELYTKLPTVVDAKFVECILYFLEANLSSTDNTERHISMIHGDFAPHNILSADNSIFYVIDYGDMSMGPIWYDIISFLFMLEMQKLNPIVRQYASERCQLAFLSGYDREIPWGNPTVQLMILHFYIRQMSSFIFKGRRGEHAADTFRRHFLGEAAGALRLCLGER